MADKGDPNGADMKEAKKQLKNIKYGLRGLSVDDALILCADDSLLKQVDSLMSRSVKRECLAKANDLEFKSAFSFNHGQFHDAPWINAKAQIICPYSFGDVKAKLIMQGVYGYKMLNLDACWGGCPTVPIYFKILVDCKRALTFDPKNVKAWLNALDVFMGFGYCPMALMCLNRALQVEPTNLKALYLKNNKFDIDCGCHQTECVLAGKPYEYICDFIAREEYKKDWFGEYDLVLRDVGEICFKNDFSPMNCESGPVCARHCQQLHHPPPDPAKDMMNITNAAMQMKTKANQLIKEKHYEDAVKLYTQALAFVPDVSDLGGVLSDELPLPEVIKERQLFKSSVYLMRASAYMLMNDSKMLRSGINDLDSVLGLDPENHKALLWRGWCYNKNNKINCAIKDYRKYVECVPGDSRAYITLQELESRK